MKHNEWTITVVTITALHHPTPHPPNPLPQPPPWYWISQLCYTCTGNYSVTSLFIPVHLAIQLLLVWRVCTCASMFRREVQRRQRGSHSKSPERVHINVTVMFSKGVGGTIQLAANTPQPSIFYTINMYLSNAAAPAGISIPCVNALILKGN